MTRARVDAHNLAVNTRRAFWEALATICLPAFAIWSLFHFLLRTQARPGEWPFYVIVVVLPLLLFVPIYSRYRKGVHKIAEQELFEAQQRLKALLEALPVGVNFSNDVTCQHIAGNPAALAQFEAKPEDNISASAPDESTPFRQIEFFHEGRQINDRELPIQRAVAENRVIPPFELEVRLPSGRKWFAEASGAPVHDRQGNVIGGVAVTVDITDRKRAEEALLRNEKLKVEQEEASKRSGKLIEAQERERTRIGRELHDDIGQRLAMLAVELQQLREVAPDSSAEVRSRVDELTKQTTEIAADIQSLSHELHSAKLEYLGLAVAMRAFCNEFAERQKIKVHFDIHDLSSPPASELSLCLFRVLQEALHNAAKHSGVRHFDVCLRETADKIQLTVSDSGAGFDIDAAKRGRGWVSSAWRSG